MCGESNLRAAQSVLSLAQGGLAVVSLGSLRDDVPEYDIDGSGKAMVMSAVQTAACQYCIGRPRRRRTEFNRG